jgi:hypothetical protein
VKRIVVSLALFAGLVAFAAPAQAADNGTGQLTVSVPASITFAFTQGHDAVNFGSVPAGQSANGGNAYLEYAVTSNGSNWNLQATSTVPGTDPSQFPIFGIRKNDNAGAFTSLTNNSLQPNPWRSGSSGTSTFKDYVKVDVGASVPPGNYNATIAYQATAL